MPRRHADDCLPVGSAFVERKTLIVEVGLAEMEGVVLGKGDRPPGGKNPKAG